MTAIVLGATVVHRWFRSPRGLMIGILTASTATGQLLFLPVLARFVESGGWRFAVTAVVCALLFALCVVFFWMRSEPAQIGLRPFGAQDHASESDELNRIDPFRQAIDALRRGVRSALGVLLIGRSLKPVRPSAEAA